MFNYLQPDPRQLSSAKKKGFSLQLWAKNKKMKEKKKKNVNHERVKRAFGLRAINFTQPLELGASFLLQTFYICGKCCIIINTKRPRQQQYNRWWCFAWLGPVVLHPLKYTPHLLWSTSFPHLLPSLCCKSTLSNANAGDDDSNSFSHFFIISHILRKICIKKW